MPSSISSCAAVFAHPQRPARAVFDVARSGIGCFTAFDVMRQMRPQPAARMCGSGLAHEADGRQEVRVDRRLERGVVHLERPALREVRRRSRRGRAARRTARRSHRPAGAARRARSRPPGARARRAPSSAAVARTRSGSRELIATDAPSPTNACADARPSPFDAAVTSATFPSSPRSMASDATLPRGVIGNPPTRRSSSSSCSSVATGACAPRTLDTRPARAPPRAGALGPARRPRDRGRVPGRCRGPERGRRWTCIARAPGETAGLRIEVTQVDDDGNVTWEIAGAAG